MNNSDSVNIENPLLREVCSGDDARAAHETPKPREVRNIQVLRGVAAMAVLLFHLMLWEGKSYGGKGVLPSIFGQGVAGVDLFFVISGFIMAYIQPAPLGNIKAYVRFLVHRFSRIYPPLWIVMIPLVGVYMVRPDLINKSNNHQVDFVASFLCLPQNHLPLLQVSWSLIYEIHYYVVVSFALMFRRTGRALFGVIWFVIVFLMYCKYADVDFWGNRWLQVIFSPFSMTFLIGYFIGLWYSWRPGSNVWLGLVSIGLAIIGFVLAYHDMPVDGYYPKINSLYRFFYYGIPCGLLVLAGVLLEAEVRRRFTSLWHLGNESYALYLLHLPILAFIYEVSESFHRSSPLFLGILAVAILCAAIAGAALFHRYIEWKATGATRKFIERRLHLIPGARSG